MGISIQFDRLVFAGVVLLSLLSGARAQPPADAFPSRGVQMVVPNEPGGGIDLVARVLAKGLTSQLGQAVVVINRSGASGNIGTASVARAHADGHTLLVTGVGHLVSPLLDRNAGYDPLTDFEPVARIAAAPNVLVLHQSLKRLTLSQLLQDPRSRTGELAFASAGYGHSSHIAAEVVMAATGARWLHVPYRGTGPASKAMITGEVQLMFVPAGSVAPLLASGKAQAMAVAYHQRLEALPDTPTFAELGLQGVEFSQWYGLFAPAGTPGEVVGALQKATATLMADGPVRRQLQSLGLEVSFMGTTEFTSFLGVEAKRLGQLVSRNGVKGALN